MINRFLKPSLFFLAIGLFMTSCFKDLDTEPIDPDVTTSTDIYSNPDAYLGTLAKLYAGLSLSGQQGPAGQPDIVGIDEGFSTYLRQYWKAQELPTDEAVIAWNDGNIHDYEDQDWDSNNEFIRAMYDRIYFQLAQINEFLRETTDAKLADRGVDDALKAEISTMRAEARFLRALSYWHALDMFQNIPFVNENDPVGNFFPSQVGPETIFNYILAEVNEIESQLPAARMNDYGRADQGALNMLKAKLFLNAEVYIGTERYGEALDACQKVIDGGYILEPEYEHLFLADNNNSNEIIFPINFDGNNSRTWGGMTFLIHAAVGGDMNASDFGIDGGWGGIRTTSALVEKFPMGVGTVVAPNEGNTDSYDVIYVPGAYQGWEPETANKLASPAGNNIYEGHVYISEPEFKFTTGPNWDNNFGDDGADGTLEPDGANITVATTGLYSFVVDMDNLTYTLEPVSWGIIGDATPTGWDSDTDMTWDADAQGLTLDIQLTDKSMKFRQNNDWAVNLGDDGADGILTQDGANIAIPAPGFYRIKLFIDRPDYTYSIEAVEVDYRAMFFTDGQSLEIDDVSQFTQGYAVTKFKNVTSTGEPGSNLAWVDTDFPMFRLADAYLMYAEAAVRSNQNLGDALTYVNMVRSRGYKNAGGTITMDQLTEDFILDERARELLWECHRRTDLIRYGLFTSGDYVWPLKGGVLEGTASDSRNNIFPIPFSDLTANPNLEQNSGY